MCSCDILHEERGIEKAEAEDTKAMIATMVVGVEHKHAKRSKKVFLQKIGTYTLTLCFGLV
jgi:hypothetical protein